MKTFKKVLLFVASFLVLGILAILGYGFYLKPKYEGTVDLKNMQQETTVYFDDYGVPHIYAATTKDAMLALGYVHAQDRLWQMELLRRIAPGRLSEIFGRVALKNDQFFAGLGIAEASDRAIAKLDKNSQSYILATAYLDGINQYIEEGKTPIEFQLVGVKKEKFTVKDIYNIFGYMAYSFALAQKEDPLLTDIKNKYGLAYLKDFGLDSSFNTVRIKDAKGKPAEYAAISKSVTALLNQSPVAPFIGSNSWVIGEQKTKNKKVIFANDPHIGTSQPGTWYEAHLVSPDYEIYGYFLAGAPFPLLGHNRDYAYGLTMFENDDVDMYQEENDPKDSNRYKTPTGYENYKTRKVTIKVKDSYDVVLNVKESKHGPIINGLVSELKTDKPIALSWIYTQQPILVLDAMYKLSHAKSKDSFQEGVQLIAAPGLNIMYGDAKGNVAWWAAGKLYKHKPGVETRLILDGASGNDEITEYLDFSKNPSATNPDWHYVYSANNQPEAIDGFLYPGYYLPMDRAKRITDLLDSKSDWDKEAVSRMITDNTSPASSEVVKSLVSNIDLAGCSENEKQAIEVLKTWKGTNNLEDVAPTIYNKWVYLYLKNTFEDELGTADFEQFLETHIMKQMIAAQLLNEKSPWWDNIKTKNKVETRKEIVATSFKEAVLALEKQLGKSVQGWTWNQVHAVEFKHPIAKMAILKKIFNVGPFPTSGSNEVINNQMFDYTPDGIYDVNGGPSTRRVIDFSDVENSWSILPTGQSGNPFSAHYDDQAAMYNQGKFRKMKMNKEEIIKSSTKLIFNPTKN